MKIRLTNNHIRLRISQNEAQDFLQHKTLQTSLVFVDNTLNYKLMTSTELKNDECKISFIGSDVNLVINSFLGKELEEQHTLSVTDGNITCDIEMDLHSRS